MFDTLAADFLSFPSLLKATPFAEGADRFVYFEASNENQDLQAERILAKALENSAPYFLRFGNIDVDHYTQIGARQGIPNYLLYEIGCPVDVRINAPSTFVKAQLFTGEGKVAEQANLIWDSLTKLSPPQRWYPSVGGQIADREQVKDAFTGKAHTVVRAVRWTNVGLSKTPVNHTMPTVSTVPVGALAKSWGANGFALDLTKALDSGGYDTNVATLTGGAALREQSLDGAPQSYGQFRDRLSDDIRLGRAKRSFDGISKHVADTYGIDPAKAAQWVEQFKADLRRHIPNREAA